jgi:hypothetical protein
VLSADDSRSLLEGIRAHVSTTKRAPTDAELLHLALQCLPERIHPHRT